MNSYLLIFNRVAGQILRETEFHDRSEAIRARFAAEREHVGEGDIEVVVLNANSHEALRKTHARYFSGIREMLRTAHA